MIGMGKKSVVVCGKRLLVLFSILLASAVQAFPCDQLVVISNWSFCATGNVSAEGGAADWKIVPAWTHPGKPRALQRQIPSRRPLPAGMANGQPG